VPNDAGDGCNARRTNLQPLQFILGEDAVCFEHRHVPLVVHVTLFELPRLAFVHCEAATGQFALHLVPRATAAAPAPCQMSRRTPYDGGSNLVCSYVRMEILERGK
jgi:hypothetical protein